MLLQLSGVLTDDAASSTWSVVLTAVSVDPLPLGALVAELFPIPEHLSRFALNNFRLELHWGPGETVLVGETPSTPVVFALLCSARLGGDTPWEVIPGLLSLSGPRLVAGYQGGRPYLDLYEKAVLFGLSWKIHLQLPIAAGSAELLSTGSVTMAGIVEHFGLHDPSKTLQSIGISHASCRFDVTNHLFGVTVELAPPEGGGWCLGPTWLQLTGVAFDLVHTPAGVAGRASASCKVGDATFRIQLEHPGPGLGWQIEASCDFPDQPGSLDHLLKKIADMLYSEKFAELKDQRNWQSFKETATDSETEKDDFRNEIALKGLIVEAQESIKELEFEHEEMTRIKSRLVGKLQALGVSKPPRRITS